MRCAGYPSAEWVTSEAHWELRRSERVSGPKRQMGPDQRPLSR
jgi:hypothetical protein